MGAGYHGNFGKTYGSDVKVFYKLGSKGESYKNYTKNVNEYSCAVKPPFRDAGYRRSRDGVPQIV